MYEEGLLDEGEITEQKIEKIENVIYSEYIMVGRSQAYSTAIPEIVFQGVRRDLQMLNHLIVQDFIEEFGQVVQLSGKILEMKEQFDTMESDQFLKELKLLDQIEQGGMSVVKKVFQSIIICKYGID